MVANIFLYKYSTCFSFIKNYLNYKKLYTIQLYNSHFQNTFRTRTVLEGINLEIKRGQFVCVTGPRDSGKVSVDQLRCWLYCQHSNVYMILNYWDDLQYKNVTTRNEK
jgi:ABC-type lipoprotein export system ATPase subunit